MYPLFQGVYAYHGEIGATYRLVENTFNEYEKCGLVEIEFLGMTEPWIVIQKNSAYKEIIKIKYVELSIIRNET